jgi:hypothetical protein
MALSSAQMQRLYGLPRPHPYTAWHWRSGGLSREPIIHRSANYKQYELDVSRLQAIMSVVPCAERITQLSGGLPFRKRPLLLIADNIAVRNWVSGKMLSVVTAADTPVYHVALER